MKDHGRKPLIILIATANDPSGEAGDLRSLELERTAILEGLEMAQARGLCQVEVRDSAGLEEICDVLQQYPGQIPVFHFGGHADSYRLLLESADGTPHRVGGQGLADFLRQQRGLQFVFLNGCSTYGHVEDLHRAGVSIVVATSRAVRDEVAAAFARRFYMGLGSGASVEGAFLQAAGEARAAAQDDPGSVLRDLLPERSHRDISDKGWPWELHVSPGAEAVREWSLSEAAQQPLFGLPDGPPGDPPRSPYLGLRRFQEEHWRIFFGRGNEIRQLFEWVTEGPEPLLLLHGQSGVGKSSLLEAGLLPRLKEDGYRVEPRRRSATEGLRDTLRSALGCVGPSTNARDAWRRIEQESGCPLLVVLDQVEEAFTQPVDPGELAILVEELSEIFLDPDRRPKGKLILGFRKEYLTEIDAHLKAERLPRRALPVMPLSRSGIIEAIEGPCGIGRYRLAIGDPEPDGEPLAAAIADDLRKDQESPIGPTLQVLLEKMWKAVEGEDERRFDSTLYGEVAKPGEGGLLDEFVGDQLRALAEWQPELAEAGLFVDLLAHHTTPLGTSLSHTYEELKASYAHQIEVLDDLVRRFDQLRLIARAGGSTRLAHDTLAPLVRHRFQRSDASGQRARRILESRTREWEESPEDALLDVRDLDTVERGRAGMRQWTAVESRLIERSREVVEAEQRAEASRESALESSRHGREDPRLALLHAVRAIESAQTPEAKQSLREALLNPTPVAVVGGERPRFTKGDEFGLGRGFRVLSATYDAGGKELLTISNEGAVAFDALTLEIKRVFTPGEAANSSGVKLRGTLPGQRASEYDTLRGCFSANSTRLAMLERPSRGGKGSRVRVVDSATGELVRVLDESERPVTRLQLDAGGSTLVSMSAGMIGAQDDARVWDVESGSSMTIQDVQDVALHPQAPQLVARGNGGLQVWTVGSEAPHRIDGSFVQTTFSPDGRWLFASNRDCVLRVWNTDGWQDRQLPHGRHVSPVEFASFSPDGLWLVTAGRAGGATVWSTSDWSAEILLGGFRGTVSALAFDPSGQWLAAGTHDRTVRLWRTDDWSEVATLDGHDGSIEDLIFAPDSSLLVALTVGQTATVWGLANLTEGRLLLGEDVLRARPAFGSGGRRLVTLTASGDAEYWNTESWRVERRIPGTARVSLSDEADFLLAVGRNNRAAVWDTRSWAKRELPLGSSESPAATSDVRHELSRRGGWVASTDTNRLMLTDLSSDDTIALDGVAAATFIPPDDAWLQIRRTDGSLALWSTDARDVAFELGGVRAATASPRGSHFGVVTQDGEVRVLELATGAEEALSARQAVQGSDRGGPGHLSLSFSPCERWLSTLEHGEKRWQVWTTATGRPAFTSEGTREYAFSPDGSWSVELRNDGRAAIVRHTERWEVRAELPPPETDDGGIWTVRFDPRGRWLLALNHEGTAQVWSTDDWTLKTALGNVRAQVREAAFDAGGERLLLSTVSEIRMWRAKDGSDAVILSSPGRDISQVGFSPDGSLAVIGDSAETFRLAAVEVDFLAQRARDRMTRMVVPDEWEMRGGAAFLTG